MTSVPNPTGHRSQASPKGSCMSATFRRSFARALVLVGAVVASAALAHPADAMAAQARDRVVHIAASKAGTPYRYGASGPRAFDCSGFTRWVFAKIGRHLPRTSARPGRRGAPRQPASNRHRGDLVFFHGPAGTSTTWHLRRPRQRLARAASGRDACTASTSGPTRCPTAGCADGLSTVPQGPARAGLRRRARHSRGHEPGRRISQSREAWVPSVARRSGRSR